MPCMNLTSAAVKGTRDRSTALSAAMTRLAWPGAPGWMMGGCGGAPALRHPPAKTTVSRTAFPDIKLFTIHEPPSPVKEPGSVEKIGDRLRIPHFLCSYSRTPGPPAAEPACAA